MVKNAEQLLTRLDEYSPKPSAYFRHGASRIARSINAMPAPAGRVLELGCDSHFTLAMSLFTNHTIVPQNAPLPITGVEDLSDPVARFTHDRTGEVRSFERRLFDIERDRFPFEDGAFDGVVCCEVLEHLFSDPAWMLQESHRVLKPGGWLLLTTPNATAYHMIRKAAMGIHPSEFSLYFDGQKYPGRSIQHTREYAFWEVIEVLEASGFACTERRTYTLQPHERLGWREYALLLPSLMAYNALNARHPKHLSLRYRRPHTFVLATKSGPPRERYPAAIYLQ